MTAPTLDLAFHLDPAAAGGSTSGCALVDPRRAEALWCRHLVAWLEQLGPELPGGLRAAGYSLGLELCDDAAIADLNRTWRRHEGPTDVLAFAALEEAPPIPAAGLAAADPTLELGDIVISLETAGRQACEAGHGLEEELLFLASHGLLHLLGWDHPDEASLAGMLERQRRLRQASPS